MSWYDIFCTHIWVYFGYDIHKLKYSLLGIPRKMVLRKCENIKGDEWSWWKLLQIRLLFLFTIPHEVVSKQFA